jgi:transposase, IS5 family
MVRCTQQVVAQTRSRLSGVMPESAHLVVSLHDVDARPIRKGRLGKPVEFGYKAQLVDNADGVILDHTVEIGNPADAPQLAPAIARISRRTGRPPRAVTADRGYGLCVGRKRSPPARRAQRGSPSSEQPRRSAARIRAPTGLPEEDQMAYRIRRADQPPQAKLRLEPHRLTGLNGARTWCGHGVFAHNLIKLSALAA